MVGDFEPETIQGAGGQRLVNARKLLGHITFRIDNLNVGTKLPDALKTAVENFLNKTSDNIPGILDYLQQKALCTHALCFFRYGFD